MDYKMDRNQDLTVAGLVHDLNNVFQTLMEAADLLSDDTQWSPVGAAILRSIERGRQISLSLQAVGQPACPFEEILENSQSFVADSLIGGRGPKIRFASNVEPGLVMKRAWAWERVLINLFWNSMRAMPQGGVISVEACRKNGTVQVKVADEGCGIPAELLPTLFEPHVTTKPQVATGIANGDQAPNWVPEFAQGGLGLHIVRTIVEQEHGHVQVSNRAGGGAEFTIVVPANPMKALSTTA
jgi:signal transduction histidine kinase